MQCFFVLFVCLPLIIYANSFNVDIETAGSVYSVEAVQGGLANLQCDITPPEAGDKMQILIWFKEKIPIYTFDRRDKKLDLGKHWSDENGLGNRGYFRYQDEPAKLMIESVKESDGGIYHCRVDFRRSPTRNVVVNLTVIIPPERVKIFNERGVEIPHYIIGPYNEGASTNITCVSTGGRPPPKVTWWQENALLDDSYEHLSEKNVQNILYLDRLERKHLHSVFTCQASNNNLIAPISTAVTLDMNLKPLWVKLVGTNKPLSAKSTYEISCEVVGSRPTPKITWWKGSEQMTDTRETTSPDGNTTTSVLTFVPNIEDNGKHFSCRGQQPFIAHSALENAWKLNINHKPLVTLEIGSNIKAETIKEGDDVYFECHIKSNPWVYKVSWKYNDNTLYSNISMGVIISNQTLVLQNLNRGKSGRYTCLGYNQEGVGESNIIQLDVKYNPICKSNQQTVYNVALHETIKVYCELQANPINIDFFWKFNNTDNSALVLDLPHNLQVSNNTRSILSYTPKTDRDYGTLLCKGTNVIGRQQEPCVFYINPAGKPDSLTNCSVVNQTLYSIEVECTAGFDGGLPQIFILEVYDAYSRQLINNVSSKHPRIFIDGLKPNQSLDLILYATNRIGRSKINRLQSNTLKSIEKRSTSIATFLQLTPILGALIGIVTAFILVAIIIVIVIRIRGDNHNPVKNCDVNSLSGSAYASVDSKNTSTEPLRTELNNSVNSLEEKDPDIIPHNNSEEVYRDEEKAFERLNNTHPMSYLRLQSLNRFDVSSDGNFECLTPRINKNSSLYYSQAPPSCLQSLSSPHISTPHRMRNPNFLPAYISRTKENQCVTVGSITSTTPLISRESNTPQPILISHRLQPMQPTQIVTRF